MLDRIQVGEPFGFYIAKLPEGAHDMAVEGLDARGRVLWDAVFPQVEFAPNASATRTSGSSGNELAPLAGGAAPRAAPPFIRCERRL